MGQVQLCHLDDVREFIPFREFFEHDNPGLKLDAVSVDGEAVLASGHGGMRLFWIYRGNGEVFLPPGYRTQEGDGKPLPNTYAPEPISPAFATTLRVVKQGLATVSAGAMVPTRAILQRWKNEAYVGDYVGELWKLDHVPRPWSTDSQIEAALRLLFTMYRDHGHSTKQVDSWEPVLEGDQFIVCADEPLRVRGQFRCLTMENVLRRTSHLSAVRRLRYLADTAGGCNPDFDPFRRLPLTWYYNYPGESDDGLNWVNSHVVNIPKETSPAHFHPPKGIGAAGGIPQREMYLTLDPAAYQLNTWGRAAALLTFPNLRDLSCYQQHPLEPGMFIYIPPGTGHRGLDVFVNVLTIPGFKPHNEYYIDRDIRDTTAGTVPFNENLLETKNYARIEDLL
ncbi:MAG: hypothetical protein ABSG53_20510 [Thermoguttaceae bacterium]